MKAEHITRKTEEMEDTVGKYIQRKRNEMGLTQELFAELIGIHQTKLSQIEANIYPSPVGDNVIEALCRFPSFQKDIYNFYRLVKRQRLPEIFYHLIEKEDLLFAQNLSRQDPYISIDDLVGKHEKIGGCYLPAE